METRPVRIDVTDDDIGRGVACDSVGCAMAIAVERALPLCECGVGTKLMPLRLIGEYKSTSVDIGHNEARFIRDFDCWKRDGLGPRPNPISFTIEVPLRFLPVEPQRVRSINTVASTQLALTPQLKA